VVRVAKIFTTVTVVSYEFNPEFDDLPLLTSTNSVEVHTSNIMGKIDIIVGNTAELTIKRRQIPGIPRSEPDETAEKCVVSYGEKGLSMRILGANVTIYTVPRTRVAYNYYSRQARMTIWNTRESEVPNSDVFDLIFYDPQHAFNVLVYCVENDDLNDGGQFAQELIQEGM